MPETTTPADHFATRIGRGAGQQTRVTRKTRRRRRRQIVRGGNRRIVAARITDRRPTAGRVFGKGLQRPIAVLHMYLGHVVVFGRDHDVPLVAAHAPDRVVLLVAGVSNRVVNPLVARADFETFEVTAGDEVDHACDCVRTVRCRRAAEQHFGAGQCGRWDDADVDAVRFGSDLTSTVDQRERTGCAEAAQVDTDDAFVALTDALELVGLTEVTGRHAELAHHLDHVRTALVHHVLLGNGVDRKRGIFGRAFDVRTRDDDLFDVGRSRFGCPHTRIPGAKQKHRECGVAHSFHCESPVLTQN